MSGYTVVLAGVALVLWSTCSTSSAFPEHELPNTEPDVLRKGRKPKTCADEGEDCTGNCCHGMVCVLEYPGGTGKCWRKANCGRTTGRCAEKGKSGFGGQCSFDIDCCEGLCFRSRTSTQGICAEP